MMHIDSIAVKWDHLKWFAREFRRGFMLNSAKPELGLLSRDELHDNTGKGVWTNQIKNVVSRLAMSQPIPFSTKGRPEDWEVGFAVSASGGVGRPVATGEFLFDDCWHSYRTSSQTTCDYQSCAENAANIGIELAFESEFGKMASPNSSINLVLDDFAKLRESRARMKVMLYLFHTNQHDELVSRMQALADTHPVRLVPQDSYLLIGGPWSKRDWKPEHREALWHFHGRAGDSTWNTLETL